MKSRRICAALHIALPILMVAVAGPAFGAGDDIPYLDQGYNQYTGQWGPANPLYFEHSPPVNPYTDPDQGGYMNPFCGSDEQASTGCVLGDYAAVNVYPFTTGNEMTVIDRTPVGTNVTGELYVTITCTDGYSYDGGGIFDDSNPNLTVDDQCPGSYYGTDVSDYVELWYHE